MGCRRLEIQPAVKQAGPDDTAAETAGHAAKPLAVSGWAATVRSRTRAAKTIRSLRQARHSVQSSSRSRAPERRKEQYRQSGFRPALKIFRLKDARRRTRCRQRTR